MNTKKILAILFSIFSTSIYANEINLGTVAMDTPVIMHQRLTPLAQFLSKETGLNIQFKASLNMSNAVNDISSGEVLIAYLTPIAYIDAKKLNPNVEALAAPLTDGKPTFTLVIATNKNNNIANIMGLKGKKFAYGDPKALVQQAVVLQGGIKNDDFASINYLNHYDNIAKALMNEDFDAGILKDTTFSNYQSKGLKEIYRSPEIPGYVFAVNNKIGEKNKTALLNAFLKLEANYNSDVLYALDKKYTGFVKVNDAHYNTIRKLIEPIRNAK